MMKKGKQIIMQKKKEIDNNIQKKEIDNNGKKEKNNEKR